MAVAPHQAAADSAARVMREGGNAVEAMIAAAATIAVVYPHMNGIGGDSFWLIAKPGEAPVGIQACGAAAQAATIPFYCERGMDSIPHRGPLAANTMAGTLSGWDAAYDYARTALGGRLPLTRLLEDAITFARDGVPLTASQVRCVTAKRDELAPIAGFAETFLSDANGPLPLQVGDRFKHPRMAETLQQLARAGLDDFYRGELARSMATELAALGSPLGLADFTVHRAKSVTPLCLPHSVGTVYNMPPPTQGLVSLLIVGMLDRVLTADMDPLGADYVHACVEATKLAFAIRDAHVTDPAHMDRDAESFLDPAQLDALAARIDMTRAAPWGKGKGPADTVWMGAIDADGVAVSFIQSIYHEFGSGIVLPSSGVNWQNRGCSFSLDPTKRTALLPGKLPFHTLNPALARLRDGRAMVYGTMGGDGQPQTQSAIFTRVNTYGWGPEEAVHAPRWLLGRTWGQASESLKLESRFPTATFDLLRARGHDVDVLAPFDETVGHAGAIVRQADGLCYGTHDPRSDGGAAS
jgi:gamma-glutamyltranspeptidase/glutathione hydrolase